jgi:hypothetical protein
LARPGSRSCAGFSLKDEFGGEAGSVEERVVSASLRIVPEDMREGVDALFSVFAIFAEDAIIPDTVIDVVAPLMSLLAGSAGKAMQKRLVRRSLQQLVKANILTGQLDTGVSVHDLVRDCMIKRAEATREGGIRQMQREAVLLLVACFEANGPAASYATGSLHWHVSQAKEPGVAIYTDALLMNVFTQKSAVICQQGALGVGVDQLRVAADACDTAGEHLTAAQLWWALAAGVGFAAGSRALVAPVRGAKASLRQLKAAGKESSASRAIERKVLETLAISNNVGIEFGSEEHNEMMNRLKELALQEALSGSTKDNGSFGSTKEAFDAKVALMFPHMVTFMGLENIAGYNGPMTLDKVKESYKECVEGMAYGIESAAIAPSPLLAEAAWRFLSCWEIHFIRKHCLPECNMEFAFGKDGAKLRELIERCETNALVQALRPLFRTARSLPTDCDASVTIMNRSTPSPSSLGYVSIAPSLAANHSACSCFTAISWQHARDSTMCSMRTDASWIA